MTWLGSAAFALWFHTLTFLLAILAQPLRLAGWPVMMAYGRFWIRATFAGLRLLAGVRWQVTGLEHLPATGPALIASLHQSAFDTMIWPILRPRCSYVLKQELTRIPLFGPALRATDMIAVDRSAGASALRVLLRGGERALGQGRDIVIFPEGTRVAPGAQAKLHPGVAALAAHTGLPVIPVVTDSGLHWARSGQRKTPGTIHIAIQPPLPAGLAREDLMRQLANSFATGATALGLPVDKSGD